MVNDKRSNAMTIAATVFSILALCSSCCIYFSLVCGAMGIIFALLSKGGELSMSQRSRSALWISVFAMVLTALLTAGAFYISIREYGSIEAMLKAYEELTEAYSSTLN